MLGCQDFCGYYDWTFQHVRRTFGQHAVRHLWQNAIGGESQKHYLDAATTEGLRGLYRVWMQTGNDEKCDWTFTLDESKNILRWDMRECPSKGFLVANDLQNDEDYCDHCIGWIAPLLGEAGFEVIAHEHNHCGQCWAEMRAISNTFEPLDLPIDIRKDPRWGRGYVDRFSGLTKFPLAGFESADPCDVLLRWFSAFDELLVLGRGPSAAPFKSSDAKNVLVTDATYATRDVFEGDPLAVLVGDGPTHLPLAAERFRNTDPAHRPLLLHAYLPGMPFVDFGALNLPRPVPILPSLMRANLYTHGPRQPYPTSGTFLVLLAAALQKSLTIYGIDLFDHASARVYASDKIESQFVWPTRHSRECEVAHLQGAFRAIRGNVTMPESLRRLISSS